MHNLLFPTDFSEAANHAFIYALKFAESLGASITTLHLYSKPDIKGVQIPPHLKKVYDELDMDAFENFSSSIPSLKNIAKANNLDDIPMDHVMLEGDAKIDISRIAKESGHDLIIMGTKGASNIKEIFIGSVTSVTMEQATCPVLAVPANAHFDYVLDHFALAVELKKRDVSVLKWMSSFAKKVNAKMDVVHIESGAEESGEVTWSKLQSDRKNDPSIVFINIKNRNVLGGLVAYFNESKADLIAMPVREREFIEELMHISLSKKLISHFNVPILGFSEHINYLT